MDEQVVPVVGMGATIYGYTDRNPATIVAVARSGKRCTLRKDRADLLNGVRSGEPDALEFHPGGFCGHMSGEQRWRIEPDPEGETIEISLRSNGRWVVVGQSARSGTSVVIGRRSKYYDFNF